MTPEQQKAIQGACEDVNLTGDERARLIMLIAANNIEGLEAILDAWMHQKDNGPISLDTAVAVGVAVQVLKGEPPYDP